MKSNVPRIRPIPCRNGPRKRFILVVWNIKCAERESRLVDRSVGHTSFLFSFVCEQEMHISGNKWALGNGTGLAKYGHIVKGNT